MSSTTETSWPQKTRRPTWDNQRINKAANNTADDWELPASHIELIGWAARRRARTAGQSQSSKRNTQKLLKWFFRRRWRTITNRRTIFFVWGTIIVSLKNPGLKGSVWNHQWCLNEPCFEGSLRHFYRFLESLFQEMVLQRTLVWKVLCGTRNGSYGITLKNRFWFQMAPSCCARRSGGCNVPHVPHLRLARPHANTC